MFLTYYLHLVGIRRRRRRNVPFLGFMMITISEYMIWVHWLVNDDVDRIWK